MHIWVDADACPGVIKEILYRVAERTRLPLTLVANQWLKTPPYPSIRAIQVPKGFDVADNHIVEQVKAGISSMVGGIGRRLRTTHGNGRRFMLRPHSLRHSAPEHDRSRLETSRRVRRSRRWRRQRRIRRCTSPACRYRTAQ